TIFCLHTDTSFCLSTHTRNTHRHRTIPRPTPLKKEIGSTVIPAPHHTPLSVSVHRGIGNPDWLFSLYSHTRCSTNYTKSAVCSS
ncbi:MAG: hypothetical protein M0Q91_16325, partial [Methanoregula sp.]|nr:hypothetical protein [Methanoregula sp.]